METASRTTTVVLIDPNNEERQYYSERLKIPSKGYYILEANNAERGLAICSTERIDCVVTELHLPYMSGFQVLIRLNPIVHRSLHTPVIALSPFILPLIIEAAKTLGAQSYLIKYLCAGAKLRRKF